MCLGKDNLGSQYFQGLTPSTLLQTEELLFCCIIGTFDYCYTLNSGDPDQIACTGSLRPGYTLFENVIQF